MGEVLLIAYGLVAVAMLVPTCLEQDAKGLSNVQRIPGVIASFVWPVTVATILVVVARDQAFRHPGREG